MRRLPWWWWAYGVVLVITFPAFPPTTWEGWGGFIVVLLAVLSFIGWIFRRRPPVAKAWHYVRLLAERVPLRIVKTSTLERLRRPPRRVNLSPQRSAEIDTTKQLPDVGPITAIPQMPPPPKVQYYGMDWECFRRSDGTFEIAGPHCPKDGATLDVKADGPWIEHADDKTSVGLRSYLVCSVCDATYNLRAGPARARLVVKTIGELRGEVAERCRVDDLRRGLGPKRDAS